MSTTENNRNNIKQRDQETFRELYKLHYESLCRYIYSRFIKDVDETGEIVQGVFVKLWENRDKISQIDSLKAYLYKSACNTALNYIAHKQVKLKYKTDAYLQLKEVEAYDDFQMDEKESDIETLTGYIEEMPIQTKEAFKLKYIKGLKYKEIAQKMNISPRTVETMIYRGLKQLREKMGIHVVSEKQNKAV